MHTRSGTKARFQCKLLYFINYNYFEIHKCCKQVDLQSYIVQSKWRNILVLVFLTNICTQHRKEEDENCCRLPIIKTVNKQIKNSIKFI